MPLNGNKKSSDEKIEYARNKCIYENGKLTNNKDILEDNYSKIKRFK